MPRYGFILSGLLLLPLVSGCGTDEPMTSPPPPVSEAENPAAQPAPQVSAENMELFMFDKNPTANQELKPTFMVNAALGTMNEEGDVFHLTQPKSIIFTDDQDELNLTAQSGTFDKKSETALLDGDVTLTSSRIHLGMQSIVWDNQTRTGHSDEAIEFSSDMVKLKAASMTLEPKTGVLVLSNVSEGIITLGAPN